MHVNLWWQVHGVSTLYVYYKQTIYTIHVQYIQTYIPK